MGEAQIIPGRGLSPHRRADIATSANVFPALSAEWRIDVPGLGDLPVIYGRGDLRIILFDPGDPVAHPSWQLPDSFRRWPPLDREVAGFLIEVAAARGQRPGVFFASTDPLFNTSSVALTSRVHFQRSLPIFQLELAVGGDRVDAYRAQLSQPGLGPPNFVISSDPGRREFRPSVTQSYAEQAAQSWDFD